MSARVASLEVNIGANVSGFQAAAGQVKAGLNNIAKDAKTAAGAVGGAGDRIDQFNAKARALNDAYATGAMSQREYTRQAKALGWSMMSNSEKFDIVKDRLGNMTQGVVRFSAAAGIAGFAAKKAFDFAKSGAEIDYTTTKFDRLARSVGSTGDVFMNELRVATKGTVSDFGLLKQGSDLLQLGLANDTKEAVRLSSVMTALGMDTGELTLALANQSKRRLDQLGLSLTKFNEIEAKLKGSGLSKEQAFKEAFMQTAEQTVMVTGNKADGGAGDMMRFEAELANVWDGMKQMFVQSTPMLFGNQSISSTMGQVSNTIRELRRLTSGETSWKFSGWNSDTNQLGFDVMNKSDNLGNLAMQQQEANNRQLFAANRGDTDFIRNLYGGGASTAADFLYEDAASRNARLRPAGAGGSAPTGEGATQTPADYAAMLAGGLDLTQMTEGFAAKTADLNDQLREENEVLAELTKTYGAGSDKVAEQKEKIDELKQSAIELGESYNNSMQSMALGMINSKDESGQLGLEFSRASGLITQDAFEAQQAIEQITSAFHAGQISAEDAAAGIGKVGDWVGELDGARVSMVVDVFIVQHGVIPTGGGFKPKDIAGGSCFTGDTLVRMADGSQKSIAAVSVGDAVKSYDVDRRAFVDGLVVEKFVHEVTNYLDIDGLHVTPEHIIWSVTAAAWVAAGSLRIGDELMLDTGETKRITSIGFIAELATVYNFEVAEVHTYFAGGVLVHNAKSNNMWTGGPLNGDGATVVGDGPGGTWTPYTEVILNGHVYNAKESRILRDAGVLDGAMYAAGGTAGQGPARRSGSRRSGGGPPGGNRTVRPGGDRHGGTLGSGPSVDGNAGATAADVANQVSSETAAVVVSSQQATQESAQLQTQQQVNAQQQTQQVLAEKLDQVVAALKKQADKNDMYTLFHSGQQTSI